MCGIAGIVELGNNPVNEAELNVLAESLKERGPDHKDMATFNSIGFLHTRLSIVDLSEEGNQPFKISHQGVDFYMTFNGEIYNFEQIRERLSQFNITYKSQTDTEVLLWAYIHLGASVIQQLRGMFAFAIYDPRKEEIVFARDHFGKKPLYYSLHNGRFLFSSHIGGIKKLSHNLTVNYEALNYYLTELSVPQPYTAWNEIKQLKPGHTLILNLKTQETKEEPYFHFKSPIEKLDISFGDAFQLVEKELTQAINRRKMGDVPIGYFLSGGVDSGLIVALAAQESKISTYSVGYENSSDNELPEAKLVADRYNTDHHELIIRPNIEQDLEDILNYFGEPFADASAIPTYYISKEMRKNVKVAISGDGGDENFGYQSYSFFHGADQFALGKSESAINRQILMSKITSRFKKGQTNYGVYKDVLGAGDKGHLFRRGMAFSDQDLSSIWSQKSNYKPAFIEEYLNTIWRENKENRVADSIFKGSFKTRLLNDYLVKVDRMSMNNSLEVRSPFLDIDFAQKMLQLPNDYKLRNETPKFILKKLAEKWLADDIMKRPKKGFAIPVNDWLKDQLKDKVEYYLDPERVQKHGLFNTDFIKNVKTEFYQSNQVSNYKIWTLICLSIWSENNL